MNFHKRARDILDRAVTSCVQSFVRRHCLLDFTSRVRDGVSPTHAAALTRAVHQTSCACLLRLIVLFRMIAIKINTVGIPRVFQAIYNTILKTAKSRIVPEISGTNSGSSIVSVAEVGGYLVQVRH